MGVREKFNEVLSPNTVTGLHVLLDQEQEIRVCNLSRKGKLISVDGEFSVVKDWVEAKELINTQSPISLAVQGKGILHKQISADSTSSDFASTIQLVKQAWPSIQVEDFYIQRFNESDRVFLSLIRQDILDKILEELAKLKLIVLDITIGGFAMHYVFPFASVIPARMKFGNEEYQLRGSEILSVSNSISSDVVADNELKIGRDFVPVKWLVSYAIALNTLALKQQNPNFISNRISQAKQEWKQSRFFKIAGWSFLLVLLSVLLVNFFLFSNYQKENQILSAKAEEVGDLVAQLTSLEEKHAAQKNFLSEAGWLQPIRSGFYLDQLAVSMPSQIQLTELSLFPVDTKKSKSENQLVIEPGVIQVRGRCSDSQILNGWLQRLVKLSWVDQVSNQNYSYDYNEQTGNFQFKIVLSAN